MVRHLPAATKDRDRTPIDPDDADWLDYDDAHYSRKTVTLPVDWEEDDATEWVVEVLYGTDRGGHINIWEDTESTLEHIWKPVTIGGDDYRRIAQVCCWDWETVLREYKRIDDASDAVDLRARDA